MNTPDPFQGIAVFMQVVQAGSFTLAAERLGHEQIGGRQGIARLEATLGVRLFQRTTRRLSLTEEGRQFSDGCQRALTELERTQALATRGKRWPGVCASICLWSSADAGCCRRCWKSPRSTPRSNWT